MNSTYDPSLRAEFLPEHLKQDKVHLWRATTGIELIHKEPTLKELNRIYENWKLMSSNMQRLSDEQSRKLFGKTNEEHYNKLLKEY